MITLLAKLVLLLHYFSFPAPLFPTVRRSWASSQGQPQLEDSPFPVSYMDIAARIQSSNSKPPKNQQPPAAPDSDGRQFLVLEYGPLRQDISAF